MIYWLRGFVKGLIDTVLGYGYGARVKQVKKDHLLPTFPVHQRNLEIPTATEHDDSAPYTSMASHHPPTIPLQTLLDKHKPHIIGFRLPIHGPMRAACYLVNYIDDQPCPKLKVVLTEVYNTREELEAGMYLPVPQGISVLSIWLQTWRAN